MRDWIKNYKGDKREDVRQKRVRKMRALYVALVVAGIACSAVFIGALMEGQNF